MSTPLVSVIMPVYNTSAYLARAIQSVVAQQYHNLEIILINDGSTDASEEVINNMHDPRIRYIRNEQNMGLVYTLNKGISMASGAFIARMDGDDICLPARISEQVAYMLAHPQVDLLATVVELINENNEPIGCWEADQQHVKPEAIRDYLPKNNCLAHPSILAKAEVMKRYGYREDQPQAEDYDLWLRMAADGVVMHKLPEVLVQHRILPNSFTRARQQNVYRKLAQTKFRFVRNAFRHGVRNRFVMTTYLYACADQIKAIGKTFKKSL